MVIITLPTSMIVEKSRLLQLQDLTNEKLYVATNKTKLVAPWGFTIQLDGTGSNVATCLYTGNVEEDRDCT